MRCIFWITWYTKYFGLVYKIFWITWCTYKQTMDCKTRINLQESADPGNPSVAAAIKDIKKAIQVKRNIHENHKY